MGRLGGVELGGCPFGVRIHKCLLVNKADALDDDDVKVKCILAAE